MTVLIFVVALVCTAAGYVVGRLIPKHWSAYFVALVLGPSTGMITFWVVGYLITGSDNLIPGFIARGTGQSFWIGLSLTPFGAFLSRQRAKTVKGDAAEVESRSSPTNGKSVTRLTVGTVPMAPRRTPPSVKRKLDPEWIIGAYGKLLAQGHSSPVQQYLKRSDLTVNNAEQLADQILSLDTFTIAGGRSTSELPAPKDDIEVAIRLAMGATRDPSIRNSFAIALMSLADFQDIEWCRERKVDPLVLQSHDQKRFLNWLNNPLIRRSAPPSPAMGEEGRE